MNLLDIGRLRCVGLLTNVCIVVLVSICSNTIFDVALFHETMASKKTKAMLKYQIDIALSLFQALIIENLDTQPIVEVDFILQVGKLGMQDNIVQLNNDVKNMEVIRDATFNYFHTIE